MTYIAFEFIFFQSNKEKTCNLNTPFPHKHKHTTKTHTFRPFLAESNSVNYSEIKKHPKTIFDVSSVLICSFRLFKNQVLSCARKLFGIDGIFDG